MGFIWWGIVLIVVGLLLSVSGFFAGSVLVNIGWLLLIVGIVLALISALSGGRTRTV